ncbi:helix-turn-helix domain-containing protein [Mycobacterium sp. SMC-8]|uniref:helix-turn-helix domain-containing protein n=1 Tax=Mycobacterium sp. SMC-8 TaxID=2857060 RepID=UPI0021B31F6C|nr:helix-turn-helix domain-containing protein [Mycobacterium sp. SMC-8]
MPAALQPRHADTTAVIGTALLHKANGLGHRRIAATMGRPVSTVRRWLRRLPPEHLDRLARDGTEQLLALDPDTFTALRYRGNMLHHALSLLSAAAYWDRRRYALGEPPWTLIGMYHPRPPSGATRLTLRRPRAAAGGIITMPADSRHHDDHRVAATITPSQCRPTPEIVCIHSDAIVCILSDGQQRSVSPSR